MEFHYIFFAGDAAKLLYVDRSTVNRWLHSGKMIGEQRGNGYWLISLDEINRMRYEHYGLLKLTKDEALEYLYE
jgi:excisionase family DNA binding protein